MDFIVTGASRGIGRALVSGLVAAGGEGSRVFALARDTSALAQLAREGPEERMVIPQQLDLTRQSDAQRVGRELVSQVRHKAVLVHNAGLWPSTRVLAEGLEVAFATHCIGPLALQAPLLQAGCLARVLVISAGLLVKGRFDAQRTPSGADFSGFRTYCTTKLAGAAAMRDVARRYPQVEFAAVHPGVVRTELGARGGLVGSLLSLIKRRWEPPAVCADRLVRLLSRPRWTTHPGEAVWFFEEEARPWPSEVERDAAAVRAAIQEHCHSSP